MYLISYDISTDSIRTKVAKKLMAHGLERMQYSVFMGPLTDTQLAKLKEELDKIFKKATEANILIIPQSPTNLKNAYHCGDKAPDFEYLSGEKLTLIL